MERDTSRPAGAAGSPGSSGTTGSGYARPGGPSVAPEAGGTRFSTPTPDDQAPADAFRSAMKSLGEAREYLGYLVSAKLDGVKLTLRRVGILAALGVVALLAGGAIVVTASVLLIAGLAQALGVLFAGDYGPRVWLGNLIVGFGVLLLIGGGTYFLMSRLFGASKRATVKKYELRRQRQRADYGHDVLQRASERDGDVKPR